MCKHTVGTNFFPSKGKVQADTLLKIRQRELRKSNSNANTRHCCCRNVCVTVFYTNYILHQAFQRHQWISETKCLQLSWQCSSELCCVLILPQTSIQLLDLSYSLLLISTKQLSVYCVTIRSDFKGTPLVFQIHLLADSYLCLEIHVKNPVSLIHHQELESS